MSLYEEYGKQIPSYYPTMYLDGFSPEQILYAARRGIADRAEDTAPDDYNIHVTSEVKKP